MKHPRMYKGIDLNSLIGKTVSTVSPYGEESAVTVVAIEPNKGITTYFLSGEEGFCINVNSNILSSRGDHISFEDCFDYIISSIISGILFGADIELLTWGDMKTAENSYYELTFFHVPCAFN